MTNRKHAPPSSLQVYEEVMREAEGQNDDAEHEALQQRPPQLQVRRAIRRKHAERSERASRAIAKLPGSTRELDE